MEKQKFTPPQLASLWGISSSKILALIRCGDLKAINVAVNRESQNPRYLIDVKDIRQFEVDRMVQSDHSLISLRNTKYTKVDGQYKQDDSNE